MPTSKGILNFEAAPNKILIPILICLSLTVLTVIAFWQVKDCGFIHLDDNAYVYENDDVQSGLNWNSIKQAFSSELAEKKSGFWHPITWLSLMFDYQIFGLNPAGFHLINLLFHVISAILLFLTLHRMTKTLWPSAFVAALFAIHPLHVESVAWVAERKDVLSTFFWMLTMGAYSYYVEHPGVRRYFFVLLFFIMGLMSKSMLVTLPFVLLLLDYWPLRRFHEIKADHKVQHEAFRPVTSDKQKKKFKKKYAVKEILEVQKTADPEYKWSLIYPLLWEKIPLFVLTILFSIITYIGEQKVGAIHSESFPLFVRIGNAITSYITYIGKTIWPSNLAVFYPLPESLPPWQVLGSALLLIAITLVVIWRAKKSPHLATGWFWYMGTLVPVIGIVQNGIISMADRYTYIPLTGLFIMVAWGTPELLKKWTYRKEILLSSSALMILCFSIVTWTQVGYWKSGATLFSHAVKATDDNWIAYDSLGLAYYDLGNYNQAIENYDRTIEIKPRHADAYTNRGNSYYELGDYKRAIENYDKSIEILPSDAKAYNNRGNAYFRSNNYGKAIENLNKAIKIKPDYAEAYNNRANSYFGSGNFKQAIEDYNQAIKIKPGYADAYSNRANSYFGSGNFKQAIEDYNRLIAIKPNYAEAYNNKGVTHGRLGNYSQSIEAYNRAIEITPDYANAYYNRGIAYGMVGKNNLAVNDLKTASKLGNESARTLLKLQGINW